MGDPEVEVCEYCDYTCIGDIGNHVALTHSKSATPVDSLAREIGKLRVSSRQRMDPLLQSKLLVDAGADWLTEAFPNGVWFVKGISTKGFGIYVCSTETNKNPCGTSWLSAHAFPKFHQECKKCAAKYKPFAMFDCRSDSDEDEKKTKSDKPHRCDLCEVCESQGCDACHPKKKQK
ncbi:hypothetical protein SARC_04376 [Sphaeroforma arctica JP610]|uniref:Uncharacterized protein n=1 Tax=Sphaeroforma arctica JP610 TaxID=667725 RepID=A0A0L0G529_9EUKA|nr:hypothetical protein SARC_04376 [Sphaeroforma arctica JP610]KNC83368.1 hypothetical protein SARC_04376 [Sphaeroforma arctica JP610]|eukprot:XP_014157270.1 hypothetical protein SARC_04376 [Sphaeroforma arctica JP610]